MLTGFTPPYTPEGRSSVVPAPPWHYAGWVYSIACRTDPAVAQTFLADGTATGRCALHWCDWQATTDGWELLDPAYAQYKEAFVLIEAERGGEVVNTCPMIWVDQDVSMVRGWLQGLPKKLGSVWMTRSLGLDHPAAAPLVEGSRLGATLAVKDRRLAEARLRLTGAPGARLGFFAHRTLGLLGLPSIVGGARPAEPVPVRMVSDHAVFGPSFAAEAEVSLFPSPRDELSALGPLEVTAASVGSVALTISRVEAVAD